MRYDPSDDVFTVGGVSCFAMRCRTGEGRKRSQLSVPGTSIYTLGGHDIDLTNMVGVIREPDGMAEPCLLKKMPDGKLGKAIHLQMAQP